MCPIYKINAVHISANSIFLGASACAEMTVNFAASLRRYHAPTGIHKLGVMAHAVIFWIYINFLFLAIVPAVARANADKLAVNTAPEKHP